MKIKNNDPRIDSAIKSHPIVDLPHGFTDRTITAIREEYPQIRFRLQFIDLALPMFLSLFSMIFLAVCVWGMNRLDHLWLEHLRLEVAHLVKLTIQGTGFEPNLLVLFSLMILMVCSLTMVWLINRPQKILRV